MTLYGLPIITSPNLPEGTILVVNPDFILPHFEIESVYKPFTGAELTFDLTWKPMSHLSMPHGWEMASIYGLDAHDDMVDAFLYAWQEPVKYRGLSRVVHALLRVGRRFR